MSQMPLTNFTIKLTIKNFQGNMKLILFDEYKHISSSYTQWTSMRFFLSMPLFFAVIISLIHVFRYPNHVTLVA